METASQPQYGPEQAPVSIGEVMNNLNEQGQERVNRATELIQQLDPTTPDQEVVLEQPLSKEEVATTNLALLITKYAKAEKEEDISIDLPRSMPINEYKQALKHAKSIEAILEKRIVAQAEAVETEKANAIQALQDKRAAVAAAREAAAKARIQKNYDSIKKGEAAKQTKESDAAFNPAEQAEQPNAPIDAEPNAETPDNTPVEAHTVESTATVVEASPEPALSDEDLEAMKEWAVQRAQERSTESTNKTAQEQTAEEAAKIKAELDRIEAAKQEVEELIRSIKEKLAEQTANSDDETPQEAQDEGEAIAEQIVFEVGIAEEALEGFNHDRLYSNPEHQAFAAIDGSGSKRGGAIAAQSVNDSFEKYWSSLEEPVTEDNAIEHTKAMFGSARKELVDITNRTPGLESMAAVATAIKFFEKSDGTYAAVVGHVGNTQLRMQRDLDGPIELLTRDEAGPVRGTDDEVRYTRLLNGLSAKRSPNLEQFFIIDNVTPGVRFMLSTNGITGDSKATYQSNEDYQSAFGESLAEDAAKVALEKSKMTDDDKAAMFIDVFPPAENAEEVRTQEANAKREAEAARVEALRARAAMRHERATRRQARGLRAPDTEVTQVVPPQAPAYEELPSLRPAMYSLNPDFLRNGTIDSPNKYYYADKNTNELVLTKRITAPGEQIDFATDEDLDEASERKMYVTTKNDQGVVTRYAVKGDSVFNLSETAFTGKLSVARTDVAASLLKTGESWQFADGSSTNGAVTEVTIVERNAATVDNAQFLKATGYDQIGQDVVAEAEDVIRESNGSRFTELATALNGNGNRRAAAAEGLILQPDQTASRRGRARATRSVAKAPLSTAPSEALPRRERNRRRTIGGRLGQMVMALSPNNSLQLLQREAVEAERRARAS